LGKENEKKNLADFVTYENKAVWGKKASVSNLDEIFQRQVGCRERLKRGNLRKGKVT